MEVELKVAEALQNDVGRGIVRLDMKTRDKLSIATGDIVEIAGKKNTGAIVWRAYSEDEGLGIIRMDGVIRQNAEVSLGDKIKLKKASPSDAKRVVLAPAQAIRFSSGFGDFVKRRLLGRPIMVGDRLVVGVLGTTLHFTVAQTLPGKITRITDYTEITVKEEPLKAEKGGIPSVTYEDIGGLTEEIQKIREMIELPMKHPELFDKLGIEPPKGVLLHGPPGTGKTLIAKALANETNAYFIPLNGPEIMSKFYGESEERLRKMFKDAETNAPSIIFIDEIDAIAPKREEVHGEVERRVVAQLLAVMDGLKSRGRVIVIGATNRPDALDPALRRPGRFDREIVIGVPDRNGRKETLQIHTRGMPIAVGDDEEREKILNELADITHGFVGADLESLCKEAAMGALRKVLPQMDLKEDIIPPDVLESLKVIKEDFTEAFKLMEPSALREVFVEIPNVTWEDVGGLDGVKRELVETIEWPLKHPHAFTKMGITPPRGILIFGPPGCGKTLLAKAVATESESNFISVKGPEMLSKWVGESEKAVRQIFKKAKQAAPTIIFFDEIDAITSHRGIEVGSRVGERVLNQLLIEMDGVEELHSVVVIAATNRPDMLDLALLRPGRFDKVLLVPAPDGKAREEILKVHTKNMPLSGGVDLEELVRLTEDCAGADIEALCREAAMLAIREAFDSGESIDSKEVTEKHFEAALKKVRPSVTKSVMERYESFLSMFESKEMEKLTYLG